MPGQSRSDVVRVQDGHRGEADGEGIGEVDGGEGWDPGQAPEDLPLFGRGHRPTAVRRAVVGCADVVREQRHSGDAGADDWAAFDSLKGLPVSSLRAELSDVFSAATQVQMQRRLPGLTAVTVPGVGHAPTLMEPVAAAALREFLDDIKRGEAR